MSLGKTSPAQAALSSAPRRPRVLIVPSWRDEPLMDGVLDEAARFGWETMNYRFLHGTTPRAFRPDGVLYCRPIERALLARCEAAACPSVQIDTMRGPPAGRGVALVMPDLEAVGRLAATHFLERGYRNLACMYQEDAAPERIVRPAFWAFRRAVEAAGGVCPAPVRLPHFDADPRAFGEAAGAWMDAALRPVGLFVWGDVAGGHLCAVCRERGIAVPDEAAILGAGNRYGHYRLSPCPLSCVDLNRRERSRAAVRLLQRMIEGAPAPSQPVLVPPARVAARQSTDMLAVADATVARSLRFIWARLAEPVSVDDIARAAGVSGKTLERRFRKALGRTVNQELLRKRLDRCGELLLSTDRSVTDLAPEIGFPSTSYLHRAFRRKFGMSPRAYRKQWRARLADGE